MGSRSYDKVLEFHKQLSFWSQSPINSLYVLFAIILSHRTMYPEYGNLTLLSRNVGKKEKKFSFENVSKWHPRKIMGKL